MTKNLSPVIEQFAPIVGSANIVVDASEQASYLDEPRKWFESRAICVVLPASTQEVAAVVNVCQEHAIPIVPQGGNTGLCGGAVGLQHGIILNLKRMNRVRRIDSEAYTMEAEAGCVLSHLQQAATDCERYFPLSLGAEGSCQIGGNLSTNAGGVNVLRYGNARDLTLGLEAVMPDGSVWNGMNSLRKNNTGYDLKNLLIGAEGTLGVITAAVLKLFPYPVHRSTALIALNSVEDAIQLFTRVRRETTDFASAFELISRLCIEAACRHISSCREPFEKLYPWHVLIELGDSTTKGYSDAVGEEFLESAIEEGIVRDAVVAASQRQADEMWFLRESIVQAQKFEGLAVKNDISVPQSGIPEFIQSVSVKLKKLCPDVKIFAFGHVGDGNLHCNLSLPEDTQPEIYKDLRERMIDLVNETAMECGGSFSAEHGIGLLKLDSMRQYKSEVELNLMRSIKTALDPKNIMNPGKVVPFDND